MVPNHVRYQAALHPDIRLLKIYCDRNNLKSKAVAHSKTPMESKKNCVSFNLQLYYHYYLSPLSPCGIKRKSMEKCIKLLILLSAAAAIAYAQTADSMVKQGSSQATVGSSGKGAPVAISAESTRKFIVHTAPTTKTNWSKVKDLFL